MAHKIAFEVLVLVGLVALGSWVASDFVKGLTLDATDGIVQQLDNVEVK